ncbi:S-layer homology domain-containing protein, partial [Vallitalea sediminicola]
VPITNGRYNTDTGKVTFTTTHFSKYAIAFVEKTFDDITNYQWAKNQIQVLASKGIINGTSNKTYAPAECIT